MSNAGGQRLFAKKVMGQGRAEFTEFKTDFSLSGKRATEDAFIKMQRALLDAQELR